MSIFDSCLMKSGWWVSRYGFDIDYGFGFISWWSTCDEWWATDDRNQRETASEARNDVSWHDELIYGILKLLENVFL